MYQIASFLWATQSCESGSRPNRPRTPEPEHERQDECGMHYSTDSEDVSDGSNGGKRGDFSSDVHEVVSTQVGPAAARVM